MATILPPPSANPNRAGVIGSGDDFSVKFAPAPAPNNLTQAGAWVGAAPAPPPPAPPTTQVTFAHLTDFVNGVTSKATVADPDELALLEVGKIVVVWPETGILGIVDDVGIRPVRILAIDGNVVTFNFDSTGLDTTNLRLLAAVYHTPTP